MFDIYFFIDIFNLFKYIFFKNLKLDWTHTVESRKKGEQVGNTVCTATLKDSTHPISFHPSRPLFAEAASPTDLTTDII